LAVNLRAMLLHRALRLETGDVVAFVGGGGKTTAMFRLADEIVAAGGRVVTTTTTRIFVAQTRLAPAHVQSLADLRAALESSPHVLLTGDIDPAEGKALGISLPLIPNLQSLFTDHQLPITNLLIEADGSRQLPFKAPAEHEPAIPNCATLVVPVVGIDAIGKPLSPQFVHRPDMIARIHAGETVTPEMVAAVLAHPLGGRKNVPIEARVIVLINKVESDEQRAVAKEIAGRLLRAPGIDGVMLGAVARGDTPIMDCFYRGESRADNE